MKILLVSATWMEVKLLTDEMLFFKEKEHALRSYEISGNEIDILITGIGTTFAAFRLTNVLNINHYDQVINIGIAGSFNTDLKIGEVVNVVYEEFGDLGIEKGKEFLTLFESGFINENEFPFENGILKARGNNKFNGLRKVRGITTNKSHGHSTSIEQVKLKFGADIETMEGAAVLYVSISMGVPCCQVRGISNYIEPRDSANWNIPLALENLKFEVLNVLKDDNTEIKSM